MVYGLCMMESNFVDERLCLIIVDEIGIYYWYLILVEEVIVELDGFIFIFGLFEMLREKNERI